MNYYNVLTRKVELLDTAMLACISEKHFAMAAIWAKMADSLETKAKEMKVEYATTIRKPTGNYSF